MATTLQLVQGATTVDLYNGTTTKARLDWQSGGVAVGNDNVSETLTIDITQTTNALLLSTRSTIFDMLRKARDRQSDPTITPVYLVFQPEGAASAWRSEVVDYVPAQPSDTYSIQWTRNKATLNITITRRNWWEANAETQIPLSNLNGTNTTNAINIYHRNDGVGTTPNDGCNYVSIAAANVTGDLRAPIRLEMTNLSNPTYGPFFVVMGHNWHDPANMTYLYEAESATGASATADANCSGGNKVSCVVPNSPLPSTKLLTWTISAATLSAAKGGYFHAYMRVEIAHALSVQNIYWWLVVDGITLAKVKPGTAEYAAYGVHDLGVFRLPQQLAGQADAAASTMELWAMQTTGADLTIGVDYLALLPADSWRRIPLQLTTYVTGAPVLQDNQIDDLCYVSAADGTSKRGAIPQGTKIWLEPGKDQRIYFIFDCDAGAITDKASVKIYHRARRQYI